MAVIRVEKVGKAYRLGTSNQRALFFEWWNRFRGRKPEFFWALRDVSFDVAAGEIVGVLGHNGAGKSTLLKILSQITRPTTGRVLVKGRVASLLEIGTGFHPELTGRENVFLNGAILGMSRREVARKFDEILEFAQIGEFIDTPVKRYSTGMRVRLAFAVAAHLDPEILVIDEVLAVGDAAFQQKCVGRIGEVAHSGRTVLFVSHNAAAVESLCTRCVVLDHGRKVFDGTQMEGLHFYAERTAQAHQKGLHERTDRGGSGEVRAIGLEFRDSQGRLIRMPRAGDPLEIRIHYRSADGQAVRSLMCDLTVVNALGAPMFTHSNFFTGEPFVDVPGCGTISCRLDSLPIVDGAYRIHLMLYPVYRKKSIFDEVHDAAELPVMQSDFFGGGKTPKVALGDGPFLTRGRWQWQVGSSRVDLQACKLEYSIVSPK